MPDGKEVVVTSDASWRAVKAEPVADWVNPAFDDSAWRPVRVLGSAFLSPWYDHELFNLRPFITPDEARAYQTHRDSLFAPADRFAAEQRPESYLSDPASGGNSAVNISPQVWQRSRSN